MGKLKNVISSFDSQADVSEEVKIQLRFLNDLAVEKAENIYNEIEKDIRTSGDAENKRVPVDVITRSTREIHIYHQQNSNVGESIKNVVKGFIGDGKPNFLTGITGLLDGALNGILGTGFGSSSYIRDYFIIPSAYGITRIETFMWVYNVNSSALTQVCQNIIVAVNFESVVDLTKISLPTFMQIYQFQLTKMGISSNEQESELQKAENTYRRLNPTLISSLGTNISILPGETLIV